MISITKIGRNYKYTIISQSLKVLDFKINIQVFAYKMLTSIILLEYIPLYSIRKNVYFLCIPEVLSYVFSFMLYTQGYLVHKEKYKGICDTNYIFSCA